MYRLLSAIRKELLLLRRDKAGILVLFLMPAVLVVIITMVQENVLKISGESTISILLVDPGHSEIGRMIAKDLEQSGKIRLIRQRDKRPNTEEDCRQRVAAGDHQACIVMPPDLDEVFNTRAKNEARRSLAMEVEKAVAPPMLGVYFDPAVLEGFRTSLLNSLRMILAGIEIQHKVEEMGRLLPKRITEQVAEKIGPQAAELFEMEETELSWRQEELVEITAKPASQRGFAAIPTSVQQNVPAWALFGMFFIAVPMGAALLNERKSGILMRLMVMPVSFLTLLAAKVAAYVLVCFVQFGLILLMGIYLLPILGAPALVVHFMPLEISLTLLAVTLAATGYGVLLGTVCRTYEQISMFGAVSVVAAAAIGGIMVPVYAMPEFMQKISVISPLGWGLDALLDIFVRGGNIGEILPEISLLLAFFAVSLIIARRSLIQRVSEGR